MMDMSCVKVNKKLKVLWNQQLDSIGRACDMIWIAIGDDVDCVNYKGEPVKKSNYAIHLQSPWRMKDSENKIIIASNDMFQPTSTTEWTEDFNWDIQGENLFDEKIRTWLHINSNLVVSKCSVNATNDLTLVFSNGTYLETFIDSSIDEECWRFFDCSDQEKEHMVVTGSSASFD